MTAAKVTLRNISPVGDLDIPALGRVIPAGEVFDVPADVAGHAPSGDDPGSGLLAQSGNYELARSSKKES